MTLPCLGPFSPTLTKGRDRLGCSGASPQTDNLIWLGVYDIDLEPIILFMFCIFRSCEMAPRHSAE